LCHHCQNIEIKKTCKFTGFFNLQNIQLNGGNLDNVGILNGDAFQNGRGGGVFQNVRGGVFHGRGGENWEKLRWQHQKLLRLTTPTRLLSKIS
jgi:hypothetical protein